jgi:hypothetical protein
VSPLFAAALRGCFERGTVGTLRAFPEPKLRQVKTTRSGAGPVTLFIHVRRATLIAHLSRRLPTGVAKDERVGKN